MSMPLLLAVLGASLGLAASFAASAWQRHRQGGRAALRLAHLVGHQKAGPLERLPAADNALFADEAAGRAARARDWLRNRARRIGGTGKLAMIGAIVLVSAAVSAGLVHTLAPFGPRLNALALIVPPLAVGWILVSQFRRRWQIAFLNGFADAIDLVIRAVRSGIPVSEAIRTAGQEIEDPVRTEFRAISDALDLGIDLKDALRQAAIRIDLADFDFLVTALILQRETGGTLAETLENLSSVLRRRKELRLKVKAMTAEGRMSAVIIGCIPLVAAAGMSFFAPDHMRLLLQPGGGRTMLGCGIGFLLSGVTVIHFLTRVRP